MLAAEDPTATPAFPTRERKTEPLLGWDLDFLELIPGWAWLAFLSAIVSIFLFGIRGAF